MHSNSQNYQARRHVRSSISTRILLLPHCCFPFRMKRDTRWASDFAFVQNILTQQRMNRKEKTAITGWLVNDFHDHLFPVSPRNHVRWLFAGFESFVKRQGSTDLTDLHTSYVKICWCEKLSKPIDMNVWSILIVMLNVEVLSSQINQKFRVGAAMQQNFEDGYWFKMWEGCTCVALQRLPPSHHS